VTAQSLSNSDLTLYGSGEQDYAGYWVSGAGDLDGDGMGDGLVGAYRRDTGDNLNVGATHVLLSSGVLANTGALSLAVSDATISGTQDYEQSGSCVSGAGDTNNDGYDDILIGAQNYDVGGRTDAGAAYLFLGPISADGMVSDAHAIFFGEQTEDKAGRSVATAGDVNNDGLADMLIGAKTSDDGGSDAGKAYLILGGVSGSVSLDEASGRFIGENISGQAGTAVAPAGDINNDGTDDVLIGASAVDAGMVYLILGNGW